MSGPASGVIAAAATAMQAGSLRRRVRQRRHLRHGRHVERRRARARRHAVGLERPRARVRDADPRADGRRPHDRRRRRLDRVGRRRRACCASAPRAPARRRGRSATAAAARGRRSPTPTWSSAGSTRSGCSPSSTRSRWTSIRAALLEHVGAPLGLDATAAAAAIVRVANDKMAGAIRMVSLARGHDPRDFALFAFGGAGPLHAAALAQRAGDPEAADPGAAGPHQRARLRRRRPAPRLRRDRQPVARRARRRPRRARSSRRRSRAARELLARENVAVEQVVTLHRADMQFQGQSHILPVAIDSTAITVAELREAFTAAYWKRFGVELPEIRPVLVNLHTAVIGKRKAVSLKAIAAAKPAASLAEARRTTRPVWFAGGWHDTPVYVRERLPVDATIRRAGDRRAARLHDGDRAGQPCRGRSRSATSSSTRRLEHAHSNDGQSHNDPDMTVDPITLSVLQNGLMQVCNEMDLAFVRSAFSPVIAEALDRSDGIYHRDSGELIAQGELGLPVFVGTMQFTVQAVIERVQPAEDRAPSGRRLHRQRPVPRRHAPDGREVRAAVLSRRQALVLARQHRPLARHRRHGAGRLLGQRHRGRAGGPAPAAGQALQAGRARRRDPVDHPVEHPHRRPAHRRHQGAGGGAGDRAGAPRRPARPLRRRDRRRRDRRAQAARGAADAREDRDHPRRRLRGRGLRRFRRRRRRAAADRDADHQDAAAATSSAPRCRST